MPNELYLINPTDSWECVSKMLWKIHTEKYGKTMIEVFAGDEDAAELCVVYHLDEEGAIFESLEAGFIRHPWAPKGKLTFPKDLKMPKE